MPVTQVVEDELYPIPEGILVPAMLISVEQVDIPFTDKKDQKKIFTKWEWEFQTQGDGGFGGITVKGNTEPKVTNADGQRGSLHLARPWVEALLGRELGLGEPLDTEDLVGLPCQITVSWQEPRAKKEGKGYWYNCEVDEVYGTSATDIDSRLPPF